MVLRGDPLFVRYGACRLLTLLAQSGTPQSCGAGPSAWQPMGREQRKRRGRGSRGGRQKLPGLRRVGLGSEGGRRAGAELGPETPSRPERGERRSEASCGRGEWRTATVGRLRRTRRCCRRRRVPSLVGPRTQRQRAASTAARTSCGRGGVSRGRRGGHRPRRGRAASWQEPRALGLGCGERSAGRAAAEGMGDVGRELGRSRGPGGRKTRGRGAQRFPGGNRPVGRPAAGGARDGRVAAQGQVRGAGGGKRAGHTRGCAH